jgi:hypothetical protein
VLDAGGNSVGALVAGGEDSAVGPLSDQGAVATHGFTVRPGTVRLYEVLPAPDRGAWVAQGVPDGAGDRS